MKTEYQVQSFFASQTFRTESDWEIIQLFCQKRHVRIGTFRPSYSQAGITGEQFIKWYNDGFGCGDIAFLDGTPAIISESGLEISRICGIISTDSWLFCDEAVNNGRLKSMTYERQFDLHRLLSRLGYEYNRHERAVLSKWIPAVNARVLYYNQNEMGLGVVRSVLPEENRVELYCFYNYTTKAIGYSMHEPDACTFHEFHFEPMTIVAQRRMNRELEKCGKVWYDKLHRIEPLEVKVKVGESYWYINDKMRVVKAIEKGTQTSQFRYQTANYFRSQEEALEALGAIADILRDRLAR